MKPSHFVTAALIFSATLLPSFGGSGAAQAQEEGDDVTALAEQLFGTRISDILSESSSWECGDDVLTDKKVAAFVSNYKKNGKKFFRSALKANIDWDNIASIAEDLLCGSEDPGDGFPDDGSGDPSDF